MIASLLQVQVAKVLNWYGMAITGEALGAFGMPTDDMILVSHWSETDQDELDALWDALAPHLQAKVLGMARVALEGFDVKQ